MKGLIWAQSLLDDSSIMNAIFKSLQTNNSFQIDILAEKSNLNDKYLCLLCKEMGSKLVTEDDYLDAYDFFVSSDYLPEAIKEKTNIITIAILHSLYYYLETKDTELPREDYRWWKEYQYYIAWYPYNKDKTNFSLLELKESRFLLVEDHFIEQPYREELEKELILKTCIDFEWDFLLKLRSKTKQKPLVTIVTVTFNLLENGREEMIKRCIESVATQDYPNIEHIIIDGASKDGTLDKLLDYQNQGGIRVISEPDSGVYDAMNKGIKQANGEFIGFLNSDDFYYDNMAISSIVFQLLRTEADYCFGDTIMFGDNDERIPWNGDINSIPYASNYCHQSLFVRTEIMRQLGGFDLSYTVSSDSDIMIRLYAGKYKYTQVHRPVVYYHMGGMSGVMADQSQKDHAKSFYLHIGRYIGLNYNECLAVWQYKFLSALELKYQVEIIRKLSCCFEITQPVVAMISYSVNLNKSNNFLKDVVKKTLHVQKREFNGRYKVFFAFGVIPFYARKL